MGIDVGQSVRRYLAAAFLVVKTLGSLGALGLGVWFLFRTSHLAFWVVLGVVWFVFLTMLVADDD